MNRNQAEKLFVEFHTPAHVQAHGRKVGELAKILAEGLEKAGIEVDSELAYLGGLIHDFVRVVDFKTLAPDLGSAEDQVFWKTLREKYSGCHHADVGADILRKRGEGVLARIVKCHKFSALGTPEGPQTWEEKLVYYADKRVKHDQIVSLEERLDEGWQRHFGDQKRTTEEEATRKAVFALEREIFSHLPESKRP